MKYLVVTDTPESQDFAKLLIEEIRRFDVRSEIFVNKRRKVEKYDETNHEFDSKHSSIKRQYLISQKFDLLIVVGEAFEAKLISKLKSIGTKTCYFQVTRDLSDGKRVNKQATRHFDKVFTDLPVYESHPNLECIGHFMSDVIRKHHFSENDSMMLNIGLLINQRKNTSKSTRFIKEFSKRHDCKWVIGGNARERLKSNTDSIKNIEISDNNLDLLKKVNAVIVDSEKDSICAALLNCPQISISGRYAPLSYSKRKSLINEVLNETLLNVYSPGETHQLENELKLLLNDHEYCASMMAGYQKFKDTVGTQPVCRMAVGKMIEWLEEIEN